MRPYTLKRVINAKHDISSPTLSINVKLNCIILKTYILFENILRKLFNSSLYLCPEYIVVINNEILSLPMLI